MQNSRLAIDGEIGPDALLPLQRFYEANFPENPLGEDVDTKARNFARMAILGGKDVGYGKLMESPMLNEAGKEAIRDRVLEMAATDPAPTVRVQAVHALRRTLGQLGDPVLLNALRELNTTETDTLVRASLDHAIRELDPATREQAISRPHGIKLGRMLRQSSDPTSTPWGEAYAYSQTTDQRTTQQLLSDYDTFKDDPEDETARQNATLKRGMAIRKLAHRAVRGEIADPREVMDLLGHSLPQEPDFTIRVNMVSTLNVIAGSHGQSTRKAIIDLFDKQLRTETNGYVRGALEGFLGELRGN